MIWDLLGGHEEGMENMIDSMVTVREEMRIEWDSVSALEPHHMILQVFSHVNKLDRVFSQMKCRVGEEKRWNRK